MNFIDDRGRLFGRVNIIDALVVLLVGAVLIAGIALVTGGSGEGTPSSTPTPEPTGDPATRVVTLDLGTHPGHVASLVRTGPTTLEGRNATVTDVYRSPNGDGGLLVAAVEVAGRTTERGFQVGETVLRYGTTATLATPEYRLGGRVVSVGADSAIETRTVTATVEANVSAAVADALEEGDTQEIAGEAVASVERVETLDTGDGWAVVQVDLSLVTRPTENGYSYGGDLVRIGRPLGFGTSRYEFRGFVVDIEANDS